MAATATTRKTRKTRKTTVEAETTPSTAMTTTTPQARAVVIKGRKRAQKVATARQIQDALSTIRDEFLACRDMGHVWRTYNIKKARGGYERSMFCRQCKTARHQFVSNRGEILTNAYSYVDGYQFKGMGRVVMEGKGIIRLEAIERALSGQHDTLIEEPPGPVGKAVPATPAS